MLVNKLSDTNYPYKTETRIENEENDTIDYRSLIARLLSISTTFFTRMNSIYDSAIRGIEIKLAIQDSIATRS